MDKLIKAITTDGNIRITAAVTTDLVGDAQRVHNSFPIATAALGRTLTAALIMGSDLKHEAIRGLEPSITLQFKGGGPLGAVLAVASSNGTVKGYASNPDVVLPAKNGKLDVGGAVGTDGYVSVVKDLRMKEPYTGISPIQTGEIAEDLAYYFATSEQTPSAVSLGVLVDTDCTVKAAGGFVMQVMPGADEFTLKCLEKTVESLPTITELLSNGAACEDLVRTVMLGFDIKILSETSDIRYHCDCSRERVERALISLGSDELENLATGQNGTEVTCSFCDEIYNLYRLLHPLGVQCPCGCSRHRITRQDLCATARRRPPAVKYPTLSRRNRLSRAQQRAAFSKGLGIGIHCRATIDGSRQVPCAAPRRRPCAALRVKGHHLRIPRPLCM